MLTLRRLADLATMVLVAVPLFGCGDSVTAGDATNNHQSRVASRAMSHTPTDAFGAAEDFAPADTSRLSRIEGRHFDLYRHYHVLAARKMHQARDSVDDDEDGDDVDEADDAKMRHAVVRFSASSLSRTLNGCSMRALMALD